ncbi:MAG: hypothetical protein F6K31_12190 [Symploca sp. SIO2G7]|nr:hypothetical protein [Symploca sp. SIO2G7]
MAKESLKRIHEQVFEEVMKNPQIQGLERGLLYKIIQIILREEESQAQEKTQEICKPLGIEPNSRRDDDYTVIADLIDVLFIDRQALAELIPLPRELGINFSISNISIKVNQQFKHNEEKKMRWFIVAAATLVGVYYCIKYLKNTQQQKARKTQSNQEKNLPSSLPPPIPAALCLVVPAKIASSFKIGSSLSANDVVHLIDNASYFLCTLFKKANSNEELLAKTNESILPDSQQEVYIRIDVNDGGRDIIDQTIPYILKRNLPTSAQFTVKELACLRNLSGLERFNRI